MFVFHIQAHGFIFIGQGEVINESRILRLPLTGLIFSGRGFISSFNSFLAELERTWQAVLDVQIQLRSDLIRASILNRILVELNPVTSI